MTKELASKLPHIYKFFEKKKALIKSKFSKEVSEVVRRIKNITATEEQIVKATVLFIKVITSKILQKDFIGRVSISEEEEFGFPPSIIKIVSELELLSAIFEDVTLQLSNIFVKSRTDNLVEFKWDFVKNLDKPKIIFKLLEVKDELLKDCGIKEYWNEKKKREQKREEEKVKKRVLTKKEQQEEYVNEIFEGNRIFEKEVLGVNARRAKAKNAKQLFRYLVFKSEAKEKFNFSYLNSYNDLKLSNTIVALSKYFLQRAENFLYNHTKIPPEIIGKILKSPKSAIFVKQLAQTYELQYGDYLKEAIVDSFFECTGSAESSKEISPVIQEAINGTSIYKPIFEIARGNSMATKAEQVWMRVRQARLERKKILDEEHKNVEYYEKKLEGIKKNIIAMRKASKLTLKALKEYSEQQLIEIALNDEGKFTEQKRVMQFVPKGDMTMYLQEKADRGARGARTPMQKEDGKKALKWYQNLHINNTEKNLKQKLQEYNNMLPEYEIKLKSAKSKYEKLEEKGIEFYDANLKVMKQIMIKNLCVTKPKI